MSTVIDSLIVRLGLDSGSLEKSAPASGKKLKDLEQQGDKTSASVKRIGTESAETSQSVSTLAESVGKLFAVIGSGLALKEFVQDQIQANAQLSRLSKNLGEQVSTVSAWGNAVEELGGNAEGLQGTLSMLSKAQTEIRVTGQSSLIPYFSMMGVSLANADGSARKVTDVLKDMSQWSQGADRTTAHNLFAQMGVNEGVINLLLQGRKEVELTIARQKEYNAVSKEQAETAEKQQKAIVGLKQKFEAFGRNLLQQSAPAIERLLSWLQGLTDWAVQNSEFIGDALKVIAVGLGAVAVAALPIDGLVLAVAALAIGILLLKQDYDTWKRGGDSLIDWEKWKPGIEAATKGLELLGKVADKTFGFLGKIASIGKNLVNGNQGAAALGIGSLFGANPNDPNAIAAAARHNAPQSATAAEMQKYFQDRGMSPAEAAGLAARVMLESHGRTNAIGDHGSAYGLLQWHPDRQANFRKWAGHDIRLSTLDEQLAFIVHELKTTERAAGNALSGATGAKQAGELTSRLYVRPGLTQAARDAEATKTGALAQLLMGVKGASAPLMAASTSGAAPASTTDSSVTNHVDTINVYAPSGDAQGLARGMDFLFTSQANSGVW